ncbi:hypothetical protein JW859_12880 [bacterium]|nr:hypothetical protein [bacterium]
MPALAARPVVGVAPFAAEIPNVGRGIARLFAQEISLSGVGEALGVAEVEALLKDAAVEYDALVGLSEDQLALLNEHCDYLVVGEVVAFAVSDRDQVVDLSDDLNDLSRMLGTGSNVAYVSLSLRLIETEGGQELAQWLLDGRESREGTRQDRISSGWAASIDFTSTDFSETMIGHATYKVLGAAIYQLTEQLPLQGLVLAVNGEALVVDLDETCGLEPGDELTILRDNGIANAEGLVVWHDYERIGSAEVVEFQPGRCLCAILDGLGLISEGDLARPVVLRYSLPVGVDSDFQD